jgi:MFS transporter, FHS family, L-fucose permease
MSTSKVQFRKIVPVLFAFMIMGFVDIIGVAIKNVQQDFAVSDFTASLLSVWVLLWFFVLGVPVGVLQDKLGKRNMLNIGMVIQAIGLGIPFIHYSFAIMFVSFILLGIGNTIIQVSANPLLQDVSPKDKLASYMSTSQFVKAIISFSGPIIAAALVRHSLDWKYVLAVYGITSILGALWLSMTPIKESKPDRKPASFSSCLGLLKNRFIALMALSIFLIVGAEVAINVNISSVLGAKYNLPMEIATLGISAFFLGETISRFLGAIILNWIKPRIFLILTTVISFIGLFGVFFAPENTLVNISINNFHDILGVFFNSEVSIAFLSIFVMGLGIGNMFPIIFSLALDKLPERANEVSGLIIMSVSGGAVMPSVMGFVSTQFSPIASISVVGACMLYILWVSFFVRKSQ